MEIEKRLQELGYQLPNPPVPAANYIGSVRVGNILFVGGNIGPSMARSSIAAKWAPRSHSSKPTMRRAIAP